MGSGQLPTARPLDPGLPVADELRRVMRDELRLVVDSCTTYASWQIRQRGVAIRRARRSLKRVRAVLELVKSGMDSEIHESLRVQARDIGRVLGPLRDRDVSRDLLARLEKDAGGRSRKEAVRLANVLLMASQPDLGIRDHRADEEVVAEAGQDSVTLLDTVETVDLDDVDRDCVLDGFERMWDRGRKRFHSKDHDRDTEWFHDTRKRAIRLQLALSPLIEIRRPELTESIRSFRRTANALGDEHDLAVLWDLVETNARHLGDPKVVKRIRSEIDRRRADLRWKGMRRGFKALKQKPAKARARLEKWWAKAAD